LMANFLSWILYSIKYPLMDHLESDEKCERNIFFLLFQHGTSGLNQNGILTGIISFLFIFFCNRNKSIKRLPF
jgi:hypothetical protein